MHSWNRQLGSLAVLVALATSAFSQTTNYTIPAASVADDFSAYHQVLQHAADTVLANALQSTETGPHPSGITVDSTIQLDATMLRRFAKRYWNGDEHNVRLAVERVTQLRPMLDAIFLEEGVSIDAAALVLVESGGRSTALSPKGARGIWQFMPDTARRYGLTVTADHDERLEAVISTRAAARYLRDLYQRFGDWQLAFAAYNAGEQTVERVVARTGHRYFSQIDHALPDETRNYVPAVLSAMELLERNQQRGSRTADSSLAGRPDLSLDVQR